jgi:2',3'-cyclic-nucleotide 2'-phosphodiesterase (5'-nucleotidase family)
MSLVITFLRSMCIFLLGPSCYREINISDYNYPTVNDRHDEYTIAIFGTNDLHGTAFPKSMVHPLTGETYLFGGVEYLARYIKILRKEWGQQILWFDSGDQFQGGIESRLSKGAIMTDFLNAIAVNSSTIGNHEFDYGREFLNERLIEATFPYLVANVFNETTGKNEDFINSQVSRLYTVGEVKIGVIGLATIETPFTTAGDTFGLKFETYKSIVIETSMKLREMGAHAVILNSHVGILCDNETTEKMILNIRTQATTQLNCKEDSEIYILLKSLEEGIIDAVVGGHVHDIVHHWVNDTPVIQTTNGGYYSNIIYLTFDKNTKKVKKNKTKIEGPLPSCEKIFTRTRRCDFISKDIAYYNDTLSTYSFHNTILKKDNSLDTIFLKWWEQVREYKKYISNTNILLYKNKTHENDLGNLMADVLKNTTNADISIINPGGFRSIWYPGSITIEDVWNMCPFDNNIVTVDISGQDLKKIMTTIQAGGKGYYQTSGLMMDVISDPKSLVENSLKLYNGTEIDNRMLYKVATLDFLIPVGGDDFREIMKWYKPVNLQIVAPQRESVINFLNKIDFITERTFINANYKRLNIITKDNK